jgi:thiamine-phosphate pyrophosphorylase
MPLRGIYALVDAGLTARPLALLEAILAGGVRIVQYRAKNGVDRTLVARLHELTRAASALLIVNDDLQAALDADGLHVGQEDLALLDASALRVALSGRLVGVSCGTPAEARAAARLGADYLGVGPYARTVTKDDAGDPLGIEGMREVVAASSAPVAAIGGIGRDQLPGVVRSGVSMAAIASAIALAPDPLGMTRELVTGWNALTA